MNTSDLHEELEWLASDHWVKLNGQVVVQGYKTWHGVISGVVQVDITQVYEKHPFAIWHKRGRMDWKERSRWVYEPSAFIVVCSSGDELNGYSKFAAVKVVECTRRHKTVLSNLIRELSTDG